MRMMQRLALFGVLLCSTACNNSEPASTTESPSPPTPTAVSPASPESELANPTASSTSASGGSSTGGTTSASSGGTTTSASSSGGSVTSTDADVDGAADAADNCLATANPDQADLDADGFGDACDDDLDGDGVANATDRCRLVADPAQLDLDKDGIGDACEDDLDGDGVADAKDNCPQASNAAQADLDDDNQGDACDADIDWDGLPNAQDNCPYVVNVEQQDLDQDNQGDACENDLDGDAIADDSDNCPLAANANQGNGDGDAFGDACDDDQDGDGLVNAADNCAGVVNLAQSDQDGDAIGDGCDDDLDGDGTPNATDNCPLLANADQQDADGNQTGNACEQDADGDGFSDALDNCAGLLNADQANADGDAQGDLCDTDDDNDTILDTKDNCPLVANTNQLDVDRKHHATKAEGDICDTGAVWVGPAGAAGSDGTLEKPFATLPEARTAAFTTGKAKIFLLAGTYATQKPKGATYTYHNVSLYGGYSYDAATKVLTRDLAQTPATLTGDFTLSNDAGTSYLWGLRISATAVSGNSTGLTVRNTADIEDLTVQIEAEAGAVLPSATGLTITPNRPNTTVTLRNSTITAGNPATTDGGATGIAVSDFDGNSYVVNGRGNTLLVQGGGKNFGIHLLEQAAQKQSRLTWRDGRITLTAAQTASAAVKVNGGGSVLLERNRIQVGDARWATGIEMNDVTASMIATNGIFIDNGTTMADSATTGLDVVQVATLRVWANTVRVRHGDRVQALYLEKVADGSLYDNVLAPADGVQSTRAIVFAPTGFTPVTLVNNLTRPLPVKYCVNDTTGDFALNDAAIAAQGFPFTASGTVVAEPQFDDQYNGAPDPFHVGAASPVINAAYNLLLISTQWEGAWGRADFRADLVGHTRPSSGGVDIGAFEVK